MHKDLIRRWLDFAAGGFDGPFDSFIADDFVGHTIGDGDIDRAELERLERGFAHAFGGTAYEIRDLIEEGDRVVLHVEIVATHRNTFYGIPPTQRRVRFGGIVIYRIAEGRVAETWSVIDFAGLVRQLK